MVWAEICELRNSARYSGAVYKARNSRWQCFVHKDGHTHVVFRGSAGLTDLRDSFDIRTTTWPSQSNAIVHRGYYERFDAIQTNICTAIKKCVDSGTFKNTITFTGHSMGGALAVMTAVKCAPVLSSLGIHVKCHTFGMPQIGNSQFIKHVAMNLGRDIVCVQVVDDIIPYLPINPSFLSMHNVIELSLLPTPYASCLLSPSKPYTLHSIMSPLLAKTEPLQHAVKQHSINTYIDCLDAIIDHHAKQKVIESLS